MEVIVPTRLNAGVTGDNPVLFAKSGDVEATTEVTCTCLEPNFVVGPMPVAQLTQMQAIGPNPVRSFLNGLLHTRSNFVKRLKLVIV